MAIADSATPPSFELSGAARCLDFVNTWGDRGNPAADRLRDYRDLLAFVSSTAMPGDPPWAPLAALARTEPDAAAAALARAVELRERLYRIFATLAGGGLPPDGELTAFGRALASALAQLSIEPTGNPLEVSTTGHERAVYHLGWSGARPHLDAPLWPLLRDAAVLLTSTHLARLRECGGERCNWLFLDRSRNRSRRWCDMASCGNRAKARRHYRRRRGAD